MLEQNVRQQRIASAKKHHINWDGTTECIEISISSNTATEFGYKEDDSGDLFRKTKDGITLNGWFLHNDNCPVAETIEELQDLCKIMNTDLLKLANAKIKTEFQNAVQGFLNRKQDSKKAVEKARKQDEAIDLKEQLDAKEITIEEYTTAITKMF